MPQEGTALISGRCVVRTADGHRVVLVASMPIAQYTIEDRMVEAHAMVPWSSKGGLSRVT